MNFFKPFFSSKKLLIPIIKHTHSWQQQLEKNKESRKVIPSLIYLYNPWKYYTTKLKLLVLRLLWDRQFNENEFIRGSKQAAIIMTDIIRTQSTENVGKYTTPMGFQQITRDMLLSRNDNKLKLMKFDAEHLRRALPVRVIRTTTFGRKYCFIDMLIVALRNTKDFDTPEEAVEIKETLHKIDTEMKNPNNMLKVKHRVVFAEIFIRFRRDYSKKDIVNGKMECISPWSISFYKILTFDVINYNPKQE